MQEMYQKTLAINLFRDREREHLNNDNLSVKKPILTYLGTFNNQNIDVKIIVQGNDPVNLRLFEAFYIRR